MVALEDTLRRLKRERDDADRRYNEALTSLDRSMPAQGAWPAPSLAYDDSKLGSLNTSWNLDLSPPASSGWRGRLAGFIWRTVAPSLQRQLTFNSEVVDHLNRNAAAARAAHASSEQLAARLREDFARLAEFHSRAIEYLQQITAYVDTRDREAASGASIINASLSGLAENVDKHWESIDVREKRIEARTAALEAGHHDLQALLSVSQQALIALKREVEKQLPASSSQLPASSSQLPASGPSGVTFRPLDSYKYVGFEDQFRGSRETIRARLESYLPLFVGASDVLDVGCGRGEFLELLAGAGVPARGIELNHDMAELCRSRGLNVTDADAVQFLTSLPDASLGGLFAAQVVEHLQPGYLLQFLELAFHKIRPGGRIVLETLNPACWTAFFDSYIRDITHVWPLHPDTLKYLVIASGFSPVDVEYRSPVSAEHKLQHVLLPAATEGALADLADTVNANVDKLNRRIYSHLDYAVIGAR